MYKNVGCELKKWAKVIVVLFTIPWAVVALCIIGWAIAEEELDLFLISLCVGSMITLVGYWISRVVGILLYAFGELVDNSTLMKDALTANTAGTALEENTISNMNQSKPVNNKMKEYQGKKEDPADLLLEEIMKEFGKKSKSSNGKFRR